MAKNDTVFVNSIDFFGDNGTWWFVTTANGDYLHPDGRVRRYTCKHSIDHMTKMPLTHENFPGLWKTKRGALACAKKYYKKVKIDG